MICRIQDFKVNLQHIESRPLPKKGLTEFLVRYEKHPNRQRFEELIKLLEAKTENLLVVGCDKPQGTLTDSLWFPKHISKLDNFAHKVLSYGSDLDADHPGFKDEEYRKRRKHFAVIAMNYKHGEAIPRVSYEKSELETWRTVYTKLRKHYPEFACAEYNTAFKLCERHCGYGPDNIPQLQDISDFLRGQTGFTLRPVAGLLSPRDFLAGLAFRVFHCTQYIRHHSVPNYTPEPDACHELLGHVPLFADPDFAQFSQEFGLISLGASDDIIAQLGTLYWFTIEFGLCLEEGQKKVYGAGLLSSFGELQNAMSEKAKNFDPDVAAVTSYPITKYQPKYFLVESFDDARIKLMKWAQKSNLRSYQLYYNPYTQKIETLENVAALKSIVQSLKGNHSLERFLGEPTITHILGSVSAKLYK
ncbi:unnamed protein product [Enterobius vermicularis]|uniref:phenylalanine 4-monooxygenase n=1 Tax=Enterobius vermicularis TaxID=51028 RepID=A0A3P6H655_ENTVE|nr:unnamed protein product [Enterobius vermicularis]